MNVNGCTRMDSRSKNQHFTNGGSIKHVIPEPEPEPEPPSGSEWLGNFSDSLEQEEFKTAGIVALSTLCIGFIMLAFIAKRLKRLRRVVAARNRRMAAESMADEFDDFFD
ncbi:MAG: hypothetical protein CM15mP47_4630 [Methanobacteriota archaeon]|nr:MAG: hypothetical protein CM15mP47_4630 [Euryarchaeota archaeon]